ncbi:PREDICTED: uncharacterized protein LOC105560626, partial [Vollenhovia emeryi]|uniref:uncharacterized protein LOC105560626 n=1 Tax=Vollenhovia emeryi TaxID=411798 RepID=UPI0005F39516
NTAISSVYEVYVKEDSGPESKNGDVAGVSGLGPVANLQLTQVINRCNNFIDNSDLRASEITFKEECVDLDTAIDSEVINIDGTVTKLVGKDALRYKIFEQSVSAPDKNVVVYSHPIAEAPPSSTPRLIDKDDPRSRLHFVKYLKRDGKTLKIWECGICSKEFRHQYTLMRHLPTHTDERNFKCEACGKAFRQLSTLSQHKAIHSDARPYVCEFCKKTFNRVSTLISHRKTHSEHKPHKCNVCGKGFHQKGNLRNHVFTHTNERPYKCELCGKGFNQMSNLVCHKVKAHAHADKMQYSCGVCGKEFPRRFALRSHEEYKHGIKYRSTSNAQSAVNEPNAGKSKNVRIIQLYNGDRNQTSESKEKDYFDSSDLMDSIVINKIDTKAMEMALFQGQTPFALYKPAKGIPVLVKISPTMNNNKHILTPATAEDLRMAGKITLNPTETSDADGNKAVQVKVPVVATVIQNIEPDGRSSFIIEPPGAEEEQGKRQSCKARRGRKRRAPLFNLSSSDDLVTALDSQFSPSALNRNEPDRQNGPSSTTSMDECNELLELAAQGGIQFVRATEDGRYEVMTNSEARDLMTQNSHDVTILDGEQADAINLVNIRNNGDVIIGDNDNQIMVLESGQKSSGMSMDAIEILEDKDIRILDSKSLDDRFVDGMTFLSQTKIDDLLLGPKPLPLDGDGALAGHDDAMAVAPSQQDLTSILGHPSNLSTSSQSSLSSLLMKNHPPLSLLGETLPYLKSSQSIAEDLNILGASPMEDHHSEYESKLKLSSVFDDDCDTGLIPFGQSDMKMFDSGSQCMKPYSDKFCFPPPKIFPGLNEVKILGPKNHSHELIVPHPYQETRFLSPYEQFLKNSMQNAYVSNTADPASEGCRKEVKILGKKLGTGIITTTEDGDIVKVVDDKSKFESTMDFCDNALQQYTTVSPRRLHRQPPMENDADNFLLQTGSPSSDFLSFGNRFAGKDLSPDGHIDRSQRNDRGDSFTSGEMLDLD